MTLQREALGCWCDDTITLMLELARGPLHAAAVELAATLAATLTTFEATDWREVLVRVERWEAGVPLPPTVPRPALRLRQLLEVQSC